MDEQDQKEGFFNKFGKFGFLLGGLMFGATAGAAMESIIPLYLSVAVGGIITLFRLIF